MPSVPELLDLGQVVLLSMSIPLAVVAARGYRDTPFGVVVLGLPVACVGFAASASAELLGYPGELGALWTAGSLVGVAGFAWFAATLVVVLRRGRRAVP